MVVEVSVLNLGMAKDDDDGWVNGRERARREEEEGGRGRKGEGGSRERFDAACEEKEEGSLDEG
eukprot:280086-Rhodomonas_salina.2